MDYFKIHFYSNSKYNCYNFTLRHITNDNAENMKHYNVSKCAMKFGASRLMVEYFHYILNILNSMVRRIELALAYTSCYYTPTGYE